MHPAYSVIFFTVASGVGFGLLIAAGALSALGLLPPDPRLALTATAVALGAAAAGLLSSMLHLGHPERAWRAFSQWRTSWLSREGVLAVASFPPALLFGAAWAGGDPAALVHGAGALAAALALATVVATGMIYQSLNTIPAWSQPLVTPVYVALALATGSLWLAALARAFGHDGAALPGLAAVALLAAWAVKRAYWRAIDQRAAGSTPETATGLGGPGTPVHLLEAPHTQENFVMREMGYRIARRHAARLRLCAESLTFAFPLALTTAVLALPEGAAGLGAVAAFLAAASASAGALLERWLFFAEARHVVTLYYGARAA